MKPRPRSRTSPAGASGASPPSSTGMAATSPVPAAPDTFPSQAEAQARDVLARYATDGAHPVPAVTTKATNATGAGEAPAPGEPASPDVWAGLVEQAAGAFVAPDFAERALNHALLVAEKVRRARRSFLLGSHRQAAPIRAEAHDRHRTPRQPAWIDLLRHAAAAERGATRLVAERFADWAASHPFPATSVVQAAWAQGDGSPAGRAGAALRALPASVAGSTEEQVRLVSWLLTAQGPERYPTIDLPALSAATSTAGVTPESASGSDAATIYQLCLALLDSLVEVVQRRGLTLRHRLHAAAVLATLPPVRALPARPAGHATNASGAVAETRLAFRPGSADPAPDLSALAERLLVPEEFLATTARLLADRGQVIFYGPPGTGKTYVARELAACLAGGAARVETVQLHPSYAYEDFVEGYRPGGATGTGSGGAGFTLTDGPLKRLARRAAADPAHHYVLVVDELNRGNVAKVFGELYFLLEYRDQPLTLQYSGTPFALPRNLWLIATMNTADRSIALVDLALRRRFYFVPFFPGQPPVEGLLRRWLERHRPHLTWLAAVVDQANRQLGDPSGAIGPSYFLRPDLDESWIALIWEHAVQPYLAERLGETEALTEFALDRLRASVAPETVPATYPARGRRRAGPRSVPPA